MEKEIIVPSWQPIPGRVSVLVDFHHQSLLQSFYLLFQKWGWNMYIPLGREWFHEGYWEIYHKASITDGLLTQYLDICNRWGLLGKEECKAREHLGYPATDAKADFPNILDLTLEECKKISLDIIIATTPQSYKAFKRLKNDHHPHARLILETGNNFPIYLEKDEYLLSSSRYTYEINNCNKCFYHQRFDTDFFHPKYSRHHINVKSVANFTHYMYKPELFEALQEMMPDWEFKSFGAGNKDDSVYCLTENISEITNKFGFIWHYKKNTDGYGHVVHNAFACGKPVITNTLYSSRAWNWDGNIPTTAAALFDDDTIIDFNKYNNRMHLDKDELAQNDDSSDLDIKVLKQIKEELEIKAKNYQYHSDKVYEKFKSVVNFEKEEEDIYNLLIPDHKHSTGFLQHD